MRVTEWVTDTLTTRDAYASKNDIVVKFETEMLRKWSELHFLSDRIVKNNVHSACNLTTMSLLLKPTDEWSYLLH